MDRFRTPVVLACLSVLTLIASGAASGVRDPPSAAAVSFTLDLVLDRTAAEPNESLVVELWLNTTGGGQMQLTRVNVSFDPDLILRVDSIVRPADCTQATASESFAEWQCTFLRAGRNYRWELPLLVASNATLGRYQFATALGIELSGGGQPAQGSDQIRIWIVQRLIHTVIYSRDAVFPGAEIEFTINATNSAAPTDPSSERNVTAFNVSLRVVLDPGLSLGLGTADLDYFVESLAPGSGVNVTIEAIVADNATTGGLIGILAVLAYEDAAGRPIGPETVRRDVLVRAPNPLPPQASTAAAIVAFALLAILGTLVAVPIVGERSIEIDEVFLMHRSGILIRHVTRGPALRKDDDLVASMFVAIQEFVRASFRTQATLDELAFGGRRTAVLRGRHVVIAALLSRGHPRFIFAQLRAAERDIERAYGDLLEDWDGRVSRLHAVDRILDTLVGGGYRRFQWRRTG